MPEKTSALDASRRLLDHIRGKTGGDAASAPAADAAQTAVGQSAGASAPKPEQQSHQGPSFGPSIKTADAGIGVASDSQGVMLALATTGVQPMVQKVAYFPYPDDIGHEPADRMRWAKTALDGFARNVTRRQVWMSLPDDKSEAYVLTLPKVKTKGAEQDSVAMLQAIAQNKFDPATTTFDYRVTAEITSQNTFKLAALGLSIGTAELESEYGLWRSIGMKPTGLTSARFASASLYASGWLLNPQGYHCVLEIGSHVSLLSIFNGRRLVSQRAIKGGTEVMLEALSNQSGFDDEDAYGNHGGAPGLFLNEDTEAAPEPVTNRYFGDDVRRLLLGTDTTPEERADVKRRITASVNRIVRQVDRSVGIFLRAEAGATLSAVLVAAPEGAQPALLEALTRTLAVPCMPLEYTGAALENARDSIKTAVAMGKSVLLSETIGLALSGETTPNVLMCPNDRRSQQMHKRIVKIIYAATVGICAVSVLATAFGAYTWFDATQELNRRLELQKKWPETFSVTTLNRELGVLNKMNEQGRMLAPKRRVSALLAELSAKRIEGIDLVEMHVAERAEMRRATGKNAAPVQTKGMSVQVRGTVQGDVLMRETALADFIRQMENSPMVTAVTVQKDANSPNALLFTATLGIWGE